MSGKMADWEEEAWTRLTEAGFTPEALARARPSELVRRAGLRADVARRVIAHYRGAPERPTEDPPATSPGPENGRGSGSEASPSPVEALEVRERVWDLGQAGSRWGLRGRVILRVSVGRRP